MADPELSGRRLGEFIVREKIGEGGYAAVYRGEQPALGREVVIKVLHAPQRPNSSAGDRFRIEARLASRLDHPYAAHVYASGIEQDGLSWIAMELVPGVTLGSWLEVHGPMPLPQFVPFFGRVAQVVQAAHQLGIVHRDLKPSNMMVIELDGDQIPKLLDFGIAKVTHQELVFPSRAAGGATARPPATSQDRQRTRTAPPRALRLTHTGSRMGSWPYMSPEQWIDASTVGPAADIYSLGVLAYQALTGRLPFTGPSSDDFYTQHRNAEVPPLGSGFSPDLDRVLRRALAKRPEDRHRDVQQLASELRAVLQADPREQLTAMARRWQERHRLPDLLARGQVLADIARCARGTSAAALGELERAFLTTSQQRAHRLAWVRRSLIALAAAVVLAGIATGAVVKARMAAQQAELQIHLAQAQTRAAQQVAEATATQAELEQGRAALLHHEPEAARHLGRAYQRGDRAASTAFMLARALQPRLAEQARLASSFGRMWSAAFSPDGTQIATTDDRNAQVWDTRTYRRRFTLPHGGAVYQAVYSGDGTRLVTAGADGAVRIWDAAHGTLVRALRRGSASPRYFAVAMSPGGQLVAAIDAKGEVAHLWDAATGAPLAEIRNDASEFPAIAFSSEGRWLATTGGDDVRVFDTRTRALALTLRGPRIHSLAFDPTGPRLVTGAATGDAAIWAIPSGARIHHLRDVGEPVDAVAFSPDGQLVAAGSRDGAEQVWHARSGELQSQLHLRRSKILAVEFDPTSKLVLAAGIDGAVVVADVALGIPVAVLEGPQSVIGVAHFDPSSRRVVGASRDGTARVWDATSPYRRWSSPPIADDCGFGTSPEPDRRFVAVGCRDHATRVWDTARDQLLTELPGVSRVEGDFTSAFPAVSAAGDRAAIARGSAVEVYELPGGRLLRTIAHRAPVNTVTFAPTGRDLVSGAVDGSLLVTRESGAQVVLPTASGGIDAAGFLPDGRVVATDAQRRFHVYDPGGSILADLELPVRVMSLRIEGTRLVTVPIAPPITDNVAPPQLLDLERYRIITQLEGHVGRVFSARWVAGNQILTVGADGMARLWDGETGQLRQTYRGGSQFLADATLTTDGLVVAGSADGLIRFWDQASGRLLWVLPAHKSQIIGVHVESGDIVTRGFTGELSRWTLPSPSPAHVIGACGDHDLCGIVQP